MTARYIIAFSIIALLSSAAYFIQMNVIKSEKSSAAKINISGRQRMLSQRTALLTRKLVSATDKARRDDIRKTLLETVSLMERSHKGLLYGDPEMNLPGSPSKKVIMRRPAYFKRQKG